MTQEMLALCREDVDFETHTVCVKNRPGHLTKSRKNRVLALPPAVAELLRRIPPKGKYVFHPQDGTQWRNNLQRDFQRIVKRAGIKRCTPHDLRRTFVSHLAMAGVNEAVVQELAGHASITTTLKYYTGIMPEALRAAQARLPFTHIFEDVSYPYHEPISGVGGETARVVRRKRATA